MYSIFNTYFSCIAYKLEIAKNKEIKQFFTDKWHDFLFRKDPFWLQIQRDVSEFSILYILYSFLFNCSWIAVAWMGHVRFWIFCARCTPRAMWITKWVAPWLPRVVTILSILPIGACGYLLSYSTGFCWSCSWLY